MSKTFSGHSDWAYAVAFSPDGRYVLSGSNDKTVKLWETVTGREVRTFSGHSREVTFVVFSPDGRYAISANTDYTENLWDMNTGRKIRTFNVKSQRDQSVVFLPDGRRFLTASGNKIVLWDTESGREIWSFTGHTDSVKSITISPNGRNFLSRSKDKTIKLWDVENGQEIRTFSVYYNLTNLGAFSPDSRYVLSTDGRNVNLCDVKNGREIRTFSGHDWAESVAFSSDGKYVFSSLSNTIKLWEASTGREIRTFSEHYLKANSMAISPDWKHVLSGGSTGTKLWKMETGEILGSMISFTDGEWISITPEGFFNASPNGAKYLNVRVGNKVYSIDNFYEKFFNPVYVASVLQGRKVEAVADIRKGIQTPPDVRITSPAVNSQFSTDTITVSVAAKDTGGGIDEIRLYHNGKAIGEDQRVIKLVSKGNEVTKNFSVTLIDGLNTFRAVGFSKDRTESNPYELAVKLTAPQKEVSLHILAVGLNKYMNPALNLNYAEPDARSIVDFFRNKGKGLFKEVDLIEIYNEKATKETITAKLKQLETTKPQDVVLIYLAGHGENIVDKWYFIPHELTDPEREEQVKTKGLSSEEFTSLIKNIKAQKILVLIDACKSGAVLLAMRGFEDRKALSQLSRSAGVHVVAASSKDQFAAEVKDLGHGVFTYTLLEGLEGKASGGTETVTVRKLMGYVEEKLPDIKKKYKQEAQFPVVDSRGQDFPLVIVK